MADKDDEDFIFNVSTSDEITFENLVLTTQDDLFSDTNMNSSTLTTDVGSITISSGADAWLSNGDTWEIKTGHLFKEFEDYLPELHKIEEMCKEYPALNNAFEKFKTVYNMCKDDWEKKNAE